MLNFLSLKLHQKHFWELFCWYSINSMCGRNPFLPRNHLMDLKHCNLIKILARNSFSSLNSDRNSIEGVKTIHPSPLSLSDEQPNKRLTRFPFIFDAFSLPFDYTLWATCFNTIGAVIKRLNSRFLKSSNGKYAADKAKYRLVDSLVSRLKRQNVMSNQMHKVAV